MKRTALLILIHCLRWFKVSSNSDAVFIREFTLTRHDDLLYDTSHEAPGVHKPEKMETGEA